MICENKAPETDNAAEERNGQRPMMIQCTEKDREMLISCLKEEAVYNTFLLADIEDFGFEEEFQTVFAEVENGECIGVYLCYYRNLLIYCRNNRVNVDFLEQLFGMFLPDVIMGRPESVRVAQWLLSDYEMETRGFYVLDGSAGLEQIREYPERAGVEDAQEIYQFLRTIPELKDMYTSEKMIADQIEKAGGTHYVIRRDGRIAAHGGIAGESADTVMIGGIATAPEYRDQHLAGQIVSTLCREILERGKTPCLFSLRGEADNLYVTLGFRRIGDWATLTSSGQDI